MNCKVNKRDDFSKRDETDRKKDPEQIRPRDSCLMIAELYVIRLFAATCGGGSCPDDEIFRIDRFYTRSRLIRFPFQHTTKYVHITNHLDMCSSYLNVKCSKLSDNIWFGTCFI